MSETIDTSLGDSEFDLAFAAAAADTALEVPQAEEPVVEDPPAEETPAVVAEETPPAEEVPTESAPPKVEEPAAKVEPPAPKVEQPVIEPPATKPPLAEPPPVQELKDYEPTAEETELLENMASVYPEVHQAFSVIEKVLTSKYENMLAKQVQAVHDYYAPMVATTNSVVADRHTQFILSQHPDALTIAEEVSSWADTQPSILKSHYHSILDKGTATEVVELLNIYKQATKPPAAEPPAPPAPPKVDVEKEKKLQALEGVRTRTTTKSAELDPDDFESAFRLAAGS